MEQSHIRNRPIHIAIPPRLSLGLNPGYAFTP